MDARQLSELPSVLRLIDRIQRVLAAYRLWLQEQRGRLDGAYLQIASLRAQGPGLQELREEVARTVLNFNGRLQDTEDDLENISAQHTLALQIFELRLQRFSQALLILGVFLVQLLRGDELPVVASPDLESPQGGVFSESEQGSAGGEPRLPSDASGVATEHALEVDQQASAGNGASSAGKGTQQASFSEDPIEALQLPWETPLMKAIFSNDTPTAIAGLPPVTLAVKEAPPALPAQVVLHRKGPAVASALFEGNICAHAIRKFRDEDDAMREERLLHRAAAKWSFIVFRYARELGLAPTSEEEVIACFGTRSVHTVTKRANTFAAFMRWLDVLTNSSISAFCDEAYWKYLRFLESSGASASSGTSFLASVRFGKYVMGLDCTEEPSRRCVGLAEKLAGQAGVVRQAAPLTVAQILVLHEKLHADATSLWDKVFCAYCLIALYGRARHSDLKRVDYIEWDVPSSGVGSTEGCQGYIIIYTRHHKTSRATAKKARLLPIIVPVAGIHSRPWIFAAKDAFEKVGLSLSGDIKGPLCRPPKDLDSKSLCNRSVTSDEISIFVRLVLGLGREAPELGERVTSHSLKRTCLSWASKAGFDRLTRCCLGRHAYTTEGTEAIYSVELGLPHVQKLESLLRFIVTGTFAPDASRSLMWAFPPPAGEVAPPAQQVIASEPVVGIPEVPTDIGEEASVDEGQSSCSTSSSSSSSESSSSDGDAKPLAKRARVSDAVPNRIDAEGGWVVHRRHAHGKSRVQDLPTKFQLRAEKSRAVMEVGGMGPQGPPPSSGKGGLALPIKAHFAARAAEVRLSNESILALKRHGFQTLGQLAYAVGQPGQLIPELEFTDWCRAHVPAASAADLASLKRLVFEAQTLALTQLRAQVTEPDAASKRVPEAERERRLQRLRDDLSGLNIEGPLEPGRKLLDECAHQEALGQLKYLSPDRCISRLHEVTHAKPSSRQVEIDQSRLVIKDAQDEISMPASSALQVQEALRRRGLAYTFAQAVTWNSYDKYVTRLFAHMHRDPPPSCNRISVSQIVEADRLVFTRLIELNIKPKQDTDGSMPMDKAPHEALESYEVSFALMHLPSKGPGNPPRPWKRLKTQHQDTPGKGKDKNKKGNGKGGKTAAPWVSIPKFIRDRGGHAATPAGEPICFTYSIHGKCAVPNCPRKHVCARCFGEHALLNHKDKVIQSQVFDVACIAALANAEVHSWTTGAYVLGGNLGARQNLTLFPLTSTLLACVLRAAQSNATFTSLALLSNQRAIVHRDLNNAAASVNTAIALSQFGGGGIWVQGDGAEVCPDPSGSELGHVLNFDCGAIQFDSHVNHATVPWSGLQRLLVAFTVKGFEAMGPDLIESLLQAQFAVPAIGTADVFLRPTSSFPVCVELFAGIGRLTSHLKAHGYPGSVCVDIQPSSSASTIPRKVDISMQVPLIIEWLRSPHVFAVHLAPPFACDEPLCFALAALVSFAVEAKHLVSFELPLSSPFWASEAGKQVETLCPHVVLLNLCCFDSEPVSSAIASNRDAFSSLQTSCTCGQPHLQPESSDRAYSWKLATRLAACIKHEPAASPPAADMSARAATLSQPKASKFPALVSEHQQVVITRGSADSADWPVVCMGRLKASLQLPASVYCHLRTLPEGSQLLRVTPDTSVKRGEPEVFISAWGLPRSPEEFVKAAVAAGHPCRNDFVLPAALSGAIERNATESSESLARSRAMFFKKWAARSIELEGAERAFKESLAPHVSQSLAPKKLLLWKELMEAFEYPDVDVFNEVTQGVLLTGPTPVTGIFPPVFWPPNRSDKDLSVWAPELRERILDRVRPQGDEDVVVHRKTVEEREMKWARGPVARETLELDALVSRRFGLKQGAKVRLVDDMSASGVNELVTVHESPKPHGPDVIAGAALAAMRRLPGVPLSGRAYDLRSAYRQLPIHPNSLKHSYVSHWNAEACSVEVDQLLALPFGAARSVYSFIRAATSIWWLGCTCLGLMWSVFFDDFVTLAKTCDTRHTDAAASALFRLLGWNFDECGSKATEFSKVFKALGVVFNLSEAHLGKVLITNTRERIDELCNFIARVVESRALSRATAQRLRGRMQFCDSYLFGRSSRLCLQTVTKHVHSGSDSVQGEDLWDALLRFRDCLKASKPHAIEANHQEPLVLFTDACYEPGSSWCAGLGAVVFSSSGVPLGFFSLCADKDAREALGEGSKKTIIFELEFLALLAALVHWRAVFKNRPLVCHIDNNTARDVAISGRGRSCVARALATGLLTLEDSGEIRCWYTRVPSPSNIADLPSRSSCTSLTIGGVTLAAE
ncbi:unnamed protein product, partial [Symbiodinium sp. CCMP2456]